MMIFGDIREFAIQCETVYSEQFNNGHVMLWICGESLGDYADTDLLEFVIAGLKGLYKWSGNELESEIFQLSPEDALGVVSFAYWGETSDSPAVLSLVRSPRYSKKYCKYLLLFPNSGSWFDHTQTVVLRHLEQYRWVWYDYTTETVHDHVVSVSSYERVFEEFVAWFEREKIHPSI